MGSVKNNVENGFDMEKIFDNFLDRWRMIDASFEIKLFCYLSACVHLILFLFTFWRNTYFAGYQILVVILYSVMGAKYTKKKFIQSYLVILAEIIGNAIVVWLFVGDTCHAEQYIIFLVLMVNYIIFFVDSFKIRMVFSVVAMLTCMMSSFWLHHVLTELISPIRSEKMQLVQSELSVFFTMSMMCFLFVWVFIQTMRNHDRVEKLKQDNSQLKISNDTDFLTGVYSRKYAQVVLEDCYRLYCETGKVFSVAIGDVDFFKSVNDEYGHEAGDIVLKQLGTLFMEYMRESDVVSRWGGEEFLFIFETDLDNAVMVMERLNKKIEQTTIFIHEKEISVTMTFGCTQIKEAETVLELLHRADSYLYWGKKAGRNRVISSKCFEENIATKSVQI